jgi:proline racemase
VSRGTSGAAGGAPDVPGETMLDKMLWLQRHGGDLRRCLLYEPRGYPNLFADLILPSTHPAADMGLIIIGPEAYVSMSGTNLICSVTVALETGMLPMREPVTDLAVETPAGLVRVHAECAEGKCRRVRFENVPSFVSQLDVPLDVSGVGPITVDVAFGGVFCAFVDVSKLGYGILPDEAAKLAHLGERLRVAMTDAIDFTHPETRGLSGLTFVCLTGRARAGGHTRNAVIISPGYVSRSPAGTATSARLAILDARKELSEETELINEGILDTVMTGRIISRCQVAGRDAIIPMISGRAWITGIHQFGLDPTDPLGGGFQLSDTWGPATATSHAPPRT